MTSNTSDNRTYRMIGTVKSAAMTRPWRNRFEPPRGSCVVWQVIDGKAVQCGEPCEGQRCAKHPKPSVALDLANSKLDRLC